MKASRFLGILFLASAVLAARPPDDAREAAKKLAAAIQGTSLNEAKPAISRLAELNNSQALSSLLKALELCTLANKVLAEEQAEIFREMRKIQPDPNQPVRGKDDRDRMDKIYVRYYSISAKFVVLADIRRAIAEAVAAMDPEVAIKPLLKSLGGSGDPNDRAFAAEALGRVRSRDVVSALAERLGREKEALVRVAIIDALGSGGMHALWALDVVAKCLKDPFWQVAFAAARMLEKTGAPDAIPHLIQALEGAEGRAREEFNEALITLTKVDKHGDHAAWKAWWERNEKAVRERTYQPPKGEAAVKGEKRGTTFYGIPVHSDKIVFVVDYSNSMHKPAKWVPDTSKVATGADLAADPLRGIRLPEDPTKIDVARYELKRAMATLRDGVKFNIVFFNHTIWPFSPRKMEILDRPTRLRAFEFIDNTGLILGTDVYEALKSAFGYAGVAGAGLTMTPSDVDTIILVSDGLPWLREDMRDQGVMDPDGILSAVREWNRHHKIVIHTVGIHADRGEDQDGKKGKGQKGEKFLRALAEENGGTYVSR